MTGAFNMASKIKTKNHHHHLISKFLPPSIGMMALLSVPTISDHASTTITDFLFDHLCNNRILNRVVRKPVFAINAVPPILRKRVKKIIKEEES
jgi:hypothetical protein